MTKSSKPDDRKTARQEKLAIALRANLQRRKAAKRAARADAQTDTDKKGEA